MNYFEQINQTDAEYLQEQLKQRNDLFNVSRRSFLRNLGIGTGSLVLGLQLPAVSAVPMKWADKPAADNVFSPSVYLKIAKDNTVTVIVHRSEMGQGIRTSLPMIVADELEVDWNNIAVEQALGDSKYGSQNTDGSRSVRRFFTPLREAAASARTMLTQAAAKKWKVAVDECVAKNSFIVHANSNRKLSFGELVDDAMDLEVPKKESLSFKSPEQFNFINQDKQVALVDGKDIAMGNTSFGIDIQREGMKVAVIARPPVIASKVKSFDATEAKKVKGVVDIVQLDNMTEPPFFKPLGGIAVIADNTWAATEARKKLKITWDWSEHREHSSKKQKQALKESSKTASNVLRNKGDTTAALGNTKQRIHAEYYTPALIHAPMEPPMATAEFKDGIMHVWACTQTPQSSQRTVSQMTGIEPDKVKIYVTLLGGGFGRKSKPDFLVEAAILAKKQGYPVKVIWTREDEVQHGYYHAESYQQLTAAIDDEKVTAWQHHVAEPPIGSTFNAKAKHITSEANLGLIDMPYNIPNVRCASGEADAHHRIGWLRSVTNVNHIFAAGSFVDELAHHLNKDPKDFLLEMIGDDRHIDLSEQAEYGNYGEDIKQYPIDTARLKGVIRKAAENSGWDNKRKDNHFMGISAHRSFASYVATVVEVSKTKDNKVKLENIWMVSDSGTVVNLERVRSQMEGAAIFGISIVKYGEITSENGMVEQSNFHNYRVARITDVPNIHVDVLINNEPPGGVGEPGVPPIAPAICNAIFAATGKRFRELPLYQQNIFAS